MIAWDTDENGDPIQTNLNKSNTEDKKMTYKEIDPSFWKPENDGDSVEGTYIGAEHEVGENKSELYTVEATDGNPVKVWGSTILDQKMVAIKSGDKIKITYLGKGEAKSGRNAPKLFKVERDE